jgi:hypothetical protein
MSPTFKIDVERDFVPRMKDLMIDTYLSAKHQLNPNGRKHSFELFGFDFLIDEDFRLWIIEVNSNPYIGQPSDFMKQVVPEMIDETLTLTCDLLYPPRVQKERKESKFEIIYSDGISVKSGHTAVNQRRPYSDSVYPFPDADMDPQRMSQGMADVSSKEF